MTDLPAADREALARVLSATGRLFDAQLAERFQRVPKWDSNWFDRWARSADDALAFDRVACCSDDELPEMLARRPSRAHARVCFHAMELLSNILSVGDGDEPLRQIIRSCKSDRELLLAALKEWRRLG